METSYFAKKSTVADPRAVSIARWPPRWWGSRRRYIALAPSAALLNKSRSGLPWTEYVKEYTCDVLDKLEPVKIYAELSNSILCCWEGPGSNCHRYLVAEWIEKNLGIKVIEVIF
jgi:hypothetical protein